MTYLHESPLRSHGNLKSSNCLVDSRWVVRISDFGLHELKFGADTGDNEMDFEKQCEKLLWKAPELLRDPSSPTSGTQKGDIYSFGIILYEIISRKGPYGHISMTPSGKGQNDIFILVCCLKHVAHYITFCPNKLK
ncbi:Guanylate cyclase 32E [Araneus ventricosus]|uniref:guanylate cyclase n=1 Tax=Araneus ventricosus TaxID=182803 RepID=A0A4Y2WJ31_ARAVE|nr:Guanylate cyclase 32E [Araneus ventricosus]